MTIPTGLIGLLAGVVCLLGFVPYIYDTIRGRTRPDKATWIIWTVLGVIIAASYYSSGARDSFWVTAAYPAGMLIVVALSFKYGKEGWSALDKACLLGAGAGLALWAATRDPALALYLTTSVDAIGGIPTIKKAYDEPQSESAWGWGLFLIANTLNLLAISEWTLAMAFYPVYVFILCIIMMALILRPAWKPVMVAGGRARPARK